MDENNNNSSIKAHVPDKEISQITLRNLEEYDYAALIARTGVPKDPLLMPRDRNDRVRNRFAALRKMIGIQSHIISGHNMATVEKNCQRNF